MEVLLNSSADSVSMIWISHPHTLPQVPCRAYFTPHGHSISSQVTEFIMFDVVHVKITQAYGQQKIIRCLWKCCLWPLSIFPDKIHVTKGLIWELVTMPVGDLLKKLTYT